MVIATLLYLVQAAGATQASYEIGRLQAQQSDLVAEQDHLKYESASLKSPAQIESEAAQRARDASRPPSDGKPRAGDAFRNAGPRAGAAPADPSPRGRQPVTPTPPSPRAPEEPRPPRTLRVDPPPIPKPQSPNAGAQDPNGPPTRERNGAGIASSNAACVFGSPRLI